MRPRRTARAAAVLLALAVLAGTPVAVVVVAPGRAAPAPSRAGEPGSADPLRPSAPFLAGVGDGVRPDGIGCQATEATALRGRVHLDAFADGARITVPAGNGGRPACRYWLPTLADDGVVHIASPERRRFTLGDVFDLWGAPLTPKRALGFALGPGRRLRVFVDGRRMAGDPRRIRLADRAQSALVLGPCAF